MPSPHETERRLIHVLAEGLLSDEAADSDLMELLWGRFTEEQRAALTERTFEVAMERLKPHVNDYLRKDPFGGVDNPIRDRVRAAARAALDQNELAAAIDAAARAEAAKLMTELPGLIRAEYLKRVRRAFAEVTGDESFHRDFARAMAGAEEGGEDGTR